MSQLDPLFAPLPIGHVTIRNRCLSTSHAPGYAIHGMYWGDGVGEAQAFHDVAMTPIDAHRIWAWSDPPLPEGWSAVYEGPASEGTFVNVRP